MIDIENVTVSIDPHEVEMEELLDSLDSGYNMDIEVYQTVSIESDQVRQLIEAKVSYMEETLLKKQMEATRYCEQKNKEEEEKRKLQSTLRLIQLTAFNEELTNEAALSKIQDLISDFHIIT